MCRIPPACPCSVWSSDPPLRSQIRTTPVALPDTAIARPSGGSAAASAVALSTTPSRCRWLLSSRFHTRIACWLVVTMTVSVGEAYRRGALHARHGHHDPVRVAEGQHAEEISSPVLGSHTRMPSPTVTATRRPSEVCATAAVTPGVGLLAGSISVPVSRSQTRAVASNPPLIATDARRHRRSQRPPGPARHARTAGVAARRCGCRRRG